MWHEAGDSEEFGSMKTLHGCIFNPFFISSAQLTIRLVGALTKNNVGIYSNRIVNV